jgi:hypothetical protein
MIMKSISIHDRTSISAGASNRECVIYGAAAVGFGLLAFVPGFQVAAIAGAISTVTKASDCFND